MRVPGWDWCCVSDRLLRIRRFRLQDRAIVVGEGPGDGGRSVGSLSIHARVARLGCTVVPIEIDPANDDTHLIRLEKVSGGSVSFGDWVVAFECLLSREHGLDPSR
jgi:hypothetical protein